MFFLDSFKYKNNINFINKSEQDGINIKCQNVTSIFI